MNYSIISPVRNEASFIEETIKSVINQDELPREWFIMDDDSTDNTRTIINGYLKDHPFIKYQKLSGFREDLRNRGGRVAAIINYADSLRKEKADLVAKIDADTSFESHFFSDIMHEFEKDPTLGIASGHMVENGIPEKIKDRDSGRGASLIIRYDCFIQIGKFIESITRGEDEIAYASARALGWKTRTFDYYFRHLKPIGYINSKLKNHYETGFYKGSIPYWLPFLLLTLIRDMFRKPYVIGTIAIVYGYINSCIILRYRPFPSFATDQIRLEQKKKIRYALGL